VKHNKVASDGKVKISINIPERLLIELDTYRLSSNQDRSIWITSAIMEKLASIKLGKINTNKDS
jgi:metal-responsive CopG/Arc/MetJ family transcriptional regulator